MKRAVFLDRDGTLNVEKEYLHLPSEFEFIPGAAEAVKLLNQAGFLVIVVSNQSGVARGYYSEEDVYHLHRHVDRLLAEQGANIDAWLFCPHHPDGRGSYALPCNCRKPEPGMLREAARRFDIDLEQSWMIGDKLIDLQAGQRAGCSSILVRTGYGAEEEPNLMPDRVVCDDLLRAVRYLLEHM